LYGEERERKGSSNLLTLPSIMLDSGTIEQYKDCKCAGFPVCLDKALVNIFGGDSLVMCLAKGYFPKLGEASRVSDVWDSAMHLLLYLEKQLGRDSVAVIEWQTLQILKTMNCKDCPFCKMEVGREKRKFADLLPSAVE
jgi:hypothetical protein